MVRGCHCKKVLEEPEISVRKIPMVEARLKVLHFKFFHFKFLHFKVLHFKVFILHLAAVKVLRGGIYDMDFSSSPLNNSVSQ
jgi:hypothetical protein